MTRRPLIGCMVALLLLTACGEPRPVPTDPDPEPLVIGVNPTSDEDPALFEPLVTGGPLEIEFGFQGLWMVVLAFRSYDIRGRVTVVARVRTADDTVIGEFGLAKQEVIAGDDGYDYYLNLFLVVEGPEYVGEEAWVEVEVEVEDKNGVSTSREVQVVLSGGEIPHIRPPPPDASTDDSASND